MTIKYPAEIDNNSSLPDAVDNVTPVKAYVINNLKKAIIAIESELGTKPSGASATVKQRLINIENSISNLEIISLSNDLGGTLSEPQVVGIRGVPISDAEPSSGQILYFNGISWIPYTLPSNEFPFSAGGDLSGSSSSQSVIKIQGRNVANTAPTANQFLGWSTSNDRWEPITLDVSLTDVIEGANYSNYLIIPISITNSQTNTNSYSTAAVFNFNPTIYKAGTRVIKLKVIGETTGPELSIRLYNLTAGAIVSGSTLTTTSTTSVLLETADISSNITNGSAIYNLQISLDTVNPAEHGDLMYAVIEIYWS